MVAVVSSTQHNFEQPKCPAMADQVSKQSIMEPLKQYLQGVLTLPEMFICF